MKILLVTSLFPPDTGVSTLRMDFFYERLSKYHAVDVLKFGDKTDLAGSIKTIDRTFFTSLLTSLKNRNKILAVLAEILPNYDLVIVSGPPYNIYEIAHAAFRLGKPFVIDLRDQPDLICSEMKGLKNQVGLRIKEFLTNQYIYSIARKSIFISCVGGISSAITQLSLKKHGIPVINVHNGFLEKDIRTIQAQPQYASASIDTLTIGCVGSLHRFRATADLHSTLIKLDTLGRKVIFRHWGSLCEDLVKTMSALRNVAYQKCPPVPREKLLTELVAVDLFLLACADDLIWEPTTSIFDYILFEKPVIFCGLRNNEAFSILENVGQKIVTSDRLEHIQEILSAPSRKSLEKTLIYSREASFTRFTDNMMALNHA